MPSCKRNSKIVVFKAGAPHAVGRAGYHRRRTINNRRLKPAVYLIYFITIIEHNLKACRTSTGCFIQAAGYRGKQR